ncbi:MAG: KOW domain-containing RNA-binding protein [Ruminiclostridium sp.]|nr:KOW domain-containing RNA-binding protein [Ruminiclostridium sp.]
MDLIKGTVVISKAGRDKGRALAVVGGEDGYVLVADGKERPLGRPKRKNPLHLAATKKTVETEGVSDKALRRALLEAVGDCSKAV